VDDRVLVFIDHQNLHGWAWRQFLPVNAMRAEGHIDPLRLAQLLTRRRRRESILQEVRVYRGRPSPTHQPLAAAANDRQTATWQRSPLVTVVRRPLRYPYDWPATPATEKGIDVALAVDMVRMAAAKEYDAAILFSSDTDLMPAIETIMDLRLGHVEISTWSGAKRLRRPNTQLPFCHFVNASEYASLRDQTDYTIP
jgi:uncharacterized LabA/DUF88 family protein